MFHRHVIAVAAFALSFAACGVGAESDELGSTADEQALNSTAASGSTLRHRPTVVGVVHRDPCRFLNEEQCLASDLCKWIPAAEAGGATITAVGTGILNGACVLAVQQDPPPPPADGGTLGCGSTAAGCHP